MAQSSLLGVNTAPSEAPGRDKSRLGPSDSSDSGSDIAGLEADDADPGLPVDVALRDDQAAPLSLGESLPASDGATGVREGADIGVDRIFTPGDLEEADDLFGEESPLAQAASDDPTEAEDEEDRDLA